MENLFYKEKRLLLSAFGEFFVRLVSYSVYTVLTFVAVVLFFSSNVTQKSLAILILLFLIDRLSHVHHGERLIYELKKDNKNIALVCTPASYRAISRAYRKACMTRRSFSLLLFIDLLDRADVREALKRFGVSAKDARQKAEKIRDDATAERKDTKEQILKNIESLACIAFGNAIQTGERFVHARNFFVALSVCGDPQVAKVFELFNLSSENIDEAIIFGKWKKMFFGVKKIPAVLGGFTQKSGILRNRVMNRAWTARPTPTLDKFGIDLTTLAREERIGLLVGHAKEFETMLHILSRSGKPNVLLMGDPGSGKASIIAHLAYRMIKDDVPPALFDMRLVSLDVPSIIANATPDIIAGRLKDIVEEVQQAGNIVLHIPNIHDLFRTNEAKEINAIDIILPIIKNESLPVISESFPKEFKMYIESRTDFLDQFEMVRVEEISEQEALRFLIYQSLLLEKEYKIFITFRAIERAVVIAHKYFRNKLLPGSASDLLKQALAGAKGDKKKVLNEEDVIKVAENQSRIPIEAAGDKEAEKLLNLEEIIHKKLINQSAAVSAVARALREYRSGLGRKGGPIATFLFVGPTGVGKTELAKILTSIQFGSKDFLLRFDMTEYQDKQSISRFIGTPDGERTGALTDAVMKNPYSLVLLDEFEKAHPDLVNLFLQVFDDGRLTDSLGRTVDFQNTIIIATSNAHSEFIKEQIEQGRKSEEIAEDIKRKLTEYFKPELINRFSDIIVFRSLTPDETKEIAGILTKEVGSMLRESHGIDLSIDAAALAQIATLGYSPIFGARPLRQVISEKIRSVLAEKILRREIRRGDVVSVSFDGKDFVWTSVAG